MASSAPGQPRLTTTAGNERQGPHAGEHAHGRAGGGAAARTSGWGLTLEWDTNSHPPGRRPWQTLVMDRGLFRGGREQSSVPLGMCGYK